MEYPYVKATVILESVDGATTVFSIPNGRNVEINEWAEPVDTELGKPWAYLQNTLNLGFTIKADFDDEKSFVYSKELLTKKAYEDRIIGQARDILRERWQDPRTKTIDTTSIVIGGERD